MITRHLLKREIDKVRDEHLTALYNIIKVFELPAGEVLCHTLLRGLNQLNKMGQSTLAAKKNNIP